MSARLFPLKDEGSHTMKFTASMLILAAVAVSRLLTVSAQETTQWPGIYTEEQAKRGQVTYSQYCSVCHGEELNSEMAPSLTGGDFTSNWADQSLGALFDKIQKTMPANSPGSLSGAQTADIIAFILHV